MPVQLHHSIHLAPPPDAVYAYVTQPWRWHEWHPNSRSASHSPEPLMDDTDLLGRHGRARCHELHRGLPV